ncbi:MAG TPA: aminotransferase class IV [Phnomibacter sp.]|nr:aminotransferase class IV [Phnomibacter sp.]
MNGIITRADKTALSLDNRAFRYGDGFFETIKCIKGKLPLWKYHSRRFFETLKALRFEIPKHLTEDSLLDNIIELAVKNQHHRVGRVRVTVFRGDGGLYDDVSPLPNILIQTWNLNPQNNFINENGLIVGNFPGGIKAVDNFANLKTNNYLLYVMAALYARDQYWNDAFVRNHLGNICDATIANIWAIRDGVLLTPPLSEGPVAGVMRQYLLDHLPETGWKTQETPFTSAVLHSADEIFITNSIFGLRWVKEYEGKNYPSFQATRINATLIAPFWAATK